MEGDIQELKNTIEEREEKMKKESSSLPQVKVDNLTASTRFTDKVDDAKVNVLADASANDAKFVEDFKEKLKEATLKAAELEKQKQEFENKYIELNKQYIETKTQLEKQTQQQNKWANKEKARQYHYNGLKDIMEFLHIKSPMNIYIMYVLAIITSPIYLVWTLIISPIWTIIVGKDNEDRPKAVKGAIWTLSLIFCAVLLVFFIYAVGRFKFGWFK